MYIYLLLKYNQNINCKVIISEKKESEEFRKF